MPACGGQATRRAEQKNMFNAKKQYKGRSAMGSIAMASMDVTSPTPR
jgi:hypothetical protein